MKIYCCGCGKKVEATLVTGKETYPHRLDLYEEKFWRCDCGLFVGVHKNSNKPLGIIATHEIKKARSHIHKILDPIWRKGVMTRSKVYKKISKEIGKDYHTANIRSIEEARCVYRIIQKIRKEINDANA